MSDVCQTRPVATPASRPFTTRGGGLSVHEVLVHVARTSQNQASVATTVLMIETVDACVRLGGLRQALSSGLKTQEELDRLAQIAVGRGSAGRLIRGELEAVQSLQADMRTRLGHVLADWARAGRHFTQLTRLLPAQLDGVWPGMPVMDSAQRRLLEQAVAASTNAVVRFEFERARDRFVAAQRRRARAAREVELGLPACTSADALSRGVTRSLLGLAQTLMQRQRQIESQLHAEADLQVAQQVMASLARPAVALRSL